MAMTLRLTDEESEALKRVAQAQGLSMQEAARKAVRQYTDDWASERDAFLQRFVVENKGLLDRLAQ